jgi:hypothetical protein
LVQWGYGINERVASYCEYLVDTSWLLMVTCVLSLISEHPQKQRSRWVLKYNQPTTREVQTGIRDVQKCHKATWYVIWLGSSCPMAWCHTPETPPTTG